MNRVPYQSASGLTPVKAVLFDAYGTLLRNEDLMLIPRQIVADHGLSLPVEDVLRT